jgi:hypothetical protein
MRIMKRLLRLFLVAMCSGLLIIIGVMRGSGGGGGLPYARVRLLSVCLHQGMSSTNVERLLGHPTATRWRVNARRWGQGTAEWLYDGTVKDHFTKKLRVGFVVGTNDSRSVTNWFWYDH